MVGRPNIRTFVSIGVLLAVAMIVLAACGDGSSTTTSSSTTSSTTPTGRPKALKPVTGTIADYNAGSNALTVKDANGTTQNFTVVSNTRIVKSQKITEQQLGSLVATDGTSVIVMGPSTGSNTYTAQELIVSDNAGITPNRNGARPNGNQAARPAQANGGKGGAGNSVVFVQKGKVQNNQLIGQNTTGQTVTVNLSGTTTLFQESAGTTSDLKSGQSVTVNMGPAQASGTSNVRQVIVGDLPTRGPATK